MAHCKNAGGGGSDDEERRPPHLTAQQKEKGPKKVMTKNKCKHGDIEAERAAAVAAVVVLREVVEAAVFTLVRPSFTLRTMI
jgi:hypothetical protein